MIVPILLYFQKWRWKLPTNKLAMHFNLCWKRLLEGSTIPIGYNKEPKQENMLLKMVLQKQQNISLLSEGIHVNELTARRLKSEYLGKLKVVSEAKFTVGEESKSKEITVNALETKRKGRLLCLV